MIEKIDNAILELITKIVWWIDIHFEKNTVWLIKWLVIFVGPFLSFLIYFIDNNYQLTQKNLTQFISLMITLRIFFFIFEKQIPEVSVVFENTKHCPNKNKTISFFDNLKIALMITYLFFEIKSIQVLFRVNDNYSTSLFLVTIFISCYLFCVDPMPPGVKRKKLEEKEMRRLRVVTE